MSSEHMPKSSETHRANQELEAAAQERLEHLRQRTEQGAADRPDQRAEAAREAIKKHESQPEPTHTEHSEPQSRPAALLSHVQNYKQTLRSLQSQLPAGARRFSQVIHTPSVERVSEVLDQTIFRPSVSLGATTTAFIVGFFFYVSARHYGFRLSGSEILVSLVVGAIIGLAAEAAATLFRRTH